MSFQGLTQAGGDIIGRESDATTREDTRTTGTTTSQLELDQAGIEKIIADVLGGATGLANIFSGEKVAGIFDSSVSAQASGDLAAKLAGEIARLTGRTVTTEDSATVLDSITETDQEGQFSKIFGSGGLAKQFGKF